MLVITVLALSEVSKSAAELPPRHRAKSESDKAIICNNLANLVNLQNLAKLLANLAGL